MIHLSPLFRDATPQEVDALLVDRVTYHTFDKGDLVISQGAAYNALLVIVRGKVRCDMTNEAGDLIVIEELAAPLPIAPAILYASRNMLPVSVTALEKTEVASITRSDFTQIMQQNEQILLAFLRSVSNRGQFLAQRVRQMRFGTIRSKLARYLLMMLQRLGVPQFPIEHTQQDLADMFGVTRPALSRVLKQLCDEGVISSHRGQFTIVDSRALASMADE